MRIIAVLLLACLGYTPIVVGQETSLPPPLTVVTGVVRDSVSGRPISGADITFRRSGRVAITDDDGRFAISGIANGAQELIVRRLGYRETTVSMVVGQGMRRLTLRIAPQPLPLDELAAAAKRTRFVLSGVVTDSFTGGPVHSAQVRFERSKVATLTDSAGRFSARVWPDELITVDGLGYMPRTLALPARLDQQQFEIRVLPDPYVLPGLEAIARSFDRIEKLAARAIVWDEAALLKHPQPSAMSFLQSQGLFTSVDAYGGQRIAWRSRPYPVEFYVDGEIVSSRILLTLPMHDVYRVIFGEHPFKHMALRSSGRPVPYQYFAIYTKSYVRFQERRGQPLWNPISIGK